MGKRNVVVLCPEVSTFLSFFFLFQSVRNTQSIIFVHLNNIFNLILQYYLIGAAPPMHIELLTKFPIVEINLEGRFPAFM